MADFDLEAFKKAFEADKAAAFTEDVWKAFGTGEWTLHRCSYDYAEDTENLDAAKDIVISLFSKNKVADKTFGLVHVLEPGLAVEGIWLIHDKDPEDLIFGTNEDTSWFSWTQLGPSMTDGVKKEILAIMTATSEYNGKSVAYSQSM
jgi:Elongation factor 1 gamma, conserved domain